MGLSTPSENPAKTDLQNEILERASSASPKILKRVEEMIIPKMQVFGPDMEERWLYELHNDFYHLAEDPNDPSGGGNYEGWTPEDIKGLYFVLYGEEMED